MAEASRGVGDSRPLANLQLVEIRSRTRILAPGSNEERVRQFAVYAQSGLQRGMSGNAIIRAAQEGGLAIRRQDALAIIRELRQGTFTAEEVAVFPRGTLPAGTGLQPALARQRRNFNYVFRFDTVDARTGATLEEGLYATLATDQLLAPDEAAAAFMRLRGVPRRTRR